MRTSQKCPKCNQEHDLSLAKCPETSSVARVLPPKPSPSASIQPKQPTSAKSEALNTVLMVDESSKVTPKPIELPKIEPETAQAEIPALALIKLEDHEKAKEPEGALIIDAPLVEPPREMIPPNTKGSSPSLAALTASLAPQPPETKAASRGETQLLGDALVLPPQSPKDRAINLYQQKLAPRIKGKEKLVAAAALAIVLLLGWVFWPNNTVTKTASNTPKESPLFSAAPMTTPSTQGADATQPTSAVGEMISLHVEAAPASTVIVVWVDGAVFHSGAAPLDINVPKGAAIEVTLAAAGYLPEQKTFTAKEEKTINESLSKLDAKPSGSNKKSNEKSGRGWSGWGGK
jgi:hypothetical protein